MKKLILLMCLVMLTQLVVAEEQVVLIPPKKNTQVPTEYELMGAILAQPRFTKMAQVTKDEVLMNVKVLASEKDFLNDTLRFGIIVESENTKLGMVSMAYICAQVELVIGPAPAEDGSEAIRLNDKWWALILYKAGGC